MKKTFLTTIALITFATSAQAFDMQTKIEEAVTQYNQNNLGASANAFGEISDHLRAEKAKKLSQFLPAAPEGWAVKKSTNTGSSVMGGASQSETIYVKGTDEVTLSLITDSKILSGLNSLASLAKTVPSEGSSKMKNYEGHTYTFEKDKYSEDYEFMMSVDDKLTISAEGKTLTEELALGLIKSIDLAKLKVEAAK